VALPLYPSTPLPLPYTHLTNINRALFFYRRLCPCPAPHQHRRSAMLMCSSSLPRRNHHQHRGLRCVYMLCIPHVYAMYTQAMPGPGPHRVARLCHLPPPKFTAFLSFTCTRLQYMNDLTGKETVSTYMYRICYCDMRELYLLHLKRREQIIRHYECARYLCRNCTGRSCAHPYRTHLELNARAPVQEYGSLVLSRDGSDSLRSPEGRA